MMPSRTTAKRSPSRRGVADRIRRCATDDLDHVPHGGNRGSRVATRDRLDLTRFVDGKVWQFNVRDARELLTPDGWRFLISSSSARGHQHGFAARLSCWPPNGSRTPTRPCGIADHAGTVTQSGLPREYCFRGRLPQRSCRQRRPPTRRSVRPHQWP